MTELISGNIWKLIANEYQERDLAIIETNKLPIRFESKNEIPSSTMIPNIPV